MSLISEAGTSSAAADKTISIIFNAVASSVMYTVPTGRKFVGKVWTNTNNAYAIINGQTYYYPHGSSYYARTPLDVVLNAGDVVKSSTNTSDYSMILGVESDA